MVYNIILGVVIYILLFMIGIAVSQQDEDPLYLALWPIGLAVQIIFYILVFFRSPVVFWKNLQSLIQRLFLFKTLAILQYICILVNILLTN